MSFVSEPRNGRGLPVEGVMVRSVKQEPSTGHCPDRYRTLDPISGSSPCVQGEFAITPAAHATVTVKPLCTGRVC